MANCEKCGKIKIEDAACGRCGATARDGSLVYASFTSSGVWCWKCDRPVSGVCDGRCNSSCYIATAVYGSYDCPEVWTLRRFRDNELSSSWFGRCFIRIYYAVSPKIVELFGNKKWFSKLWKPIIDKIVRKLQKEN